MEHQVYLVALNEIHRESQLYTTGLLVNRKE